MWNSPAPAARLPRPAPPTHVTSGSAPARPRPPLSSRSPLGRLCASAADSVAAPAPSSASPPPPPPGASGGRLSGWPRASAVALASRQRLPQEEARRPRSRSGPQFSPSFRRRGSWRSGRGRGTGRRGSNGRRTGGYPYLRMRDSPVAVALPPLGRPPPRCPPAPGSAAFNVGVLGILDSAPQVGRFVEIAPFSLKREEMKPCP